MKLEEKLAELQRRSKLEDEGGGLSATKSSTKEGKMTVRVFCVTPPPPTIFGRQET